MLGQLTLCPGGRGGAEAGSLYGLSVLRARADPEGFWGERRLRRAGRSLRRGGALRVLVPGEFGRWPLLAALGLRPVETEGFVRAQSAPLANYTNEIMASRFSEVMWLMEQVMWKRFDQRLAQFLLEESALEGTQTLYLTHEKIANHLGTAREVVTRMLRYFQSEGMVQLRRGVVELTDRAKLASL